LRIFIDDDMQTISEKRNAPAVHLVFKEVVGTLWFVGDQFQQVGSSNSRILGSMIKAHASESFCFIPPVNLPARRCLNRSMSNIAR